uniref:Uncharacterized protein n=1 Tax=Amphimedon queenslandica TaxID=400682 RepID=A0A1X7VGT9_AMPQE
MSKRTFDYLCNEVRALLQRQDTTIRRGISKPKCVAITLWCMATCSEYRTLMVLPSELCVAVHETIHAIVKKLLHVYIKFPMRQSLINMVNEFEEKWGLP